MVLRFAAKVLWGTSKIMVKHIVIPIAITAATAVVLDELTKKVRADKAPNGRINVIRPGR